MSFYYFVLYFFIYGTLGWCTEVAYAAVKEGRFVNRGFLNGPICPIYGVGVSVVVHFLQPLSEQLILLYIGSTILVTLLEGITGYVLEKLFHHKWWDYSGMPWNIGGYVCLVFSLMWGVACVFIVKVIHPLIHGVLQLLPVAAGIVLMVICGVGMCSDLVVTVNRILKLNRQLDAMEKIAAELRGLSDKLGENIYENVMDTMEIREKVDQAVEEGKQKVDQAVEESRQKMDRAVEESRQKMDRAVEEQRARMSELKERYRELAERNVKGGRRLLKAFPKLESKNHKEILEEIRLKLKR